MYTEVSSNNCKSSVSRRHERLYFALPGVLVNKDFGRVAWDLVGRGLSWIVCCLLRFNRARTTADCRLAGGCLLVQLMQLLLLVCSVIAGANPFCRRPDARWTGDIPIDLERRRQGEDWMLAFWHQVAEWPGGQVAGIMLAGTLLPCCPPPPAGPLALAPAPGGARHPAGT